MKRIAAVLVALSAVVGSSLAAAPAQAAGVSVCTITANYAHGSTHVNGTINATGTATCTPNAPTVYLKTTLIRQDGVTYPGSPVERSNVSKMSTNAATSCANGKRTFVTRVEYAVTAPAGYAPHYQAGHIDSQAIGPVCSNAGSRAIADEFTQKWLNAPVPEPVSVTISYELEKVG